MKTRLFLVTVHYEDHKESSAYGIEADNDVAARASALLFVENENAHRWGRGFEPLRVDYCEITLFADVRES